MTEQEHIGSVAVGDIGELEEAKSIAADINSLLPGEMRQMTFWHNAALKMAAVLSRPVQEPVARVSDYRKSDGTTDFFVMIGKNENAMSLHMHKIRGRAEYEAAEINHALTGSPKPEFSDFDLDAPQPAPGTSATDPMLSEISLVDVERLARSIVTAACELGGPADPEAVNTISITTNDLEAVVHRHVTAALEAAQ